MIQTQILQLIIDQPTFSPLAEQDHGSHYDAHRKAKAASRWYFHKGFEHAGFLQRQQRSGDPSVSKRERRQKEINLQNGDMALGSYRQLLHFWEFFSISRIH